MSKKPGMLFGFLFVFFVLSIAPYLLDGAAAERAAPRFGGVLDVTRVVCPDNATTSMRLLFDGGETVGEPITATDPNGDPVYHSLARLGDSPSFAFFDIATSTGALTVSPIGADDDVGLDVGLHHLRVVADDGGLVRGEVGVTVQVVKRAAPAGDGVCS